MAIPVCASLFLLAMFTIIVVATDAFVLNHDSKKRLLKTTTVLHGAFHRRNKQEDLQKKMQLAKEQAAAKKKPPQTSSSTSKKRDLKEEEEEIKRQNDRKRFEQLLNSESVTSYNPDAEDIFYLSKEQEEEEMDAGFRGVDRLFEGDKAPTLSFQDLVSIQSENALGNAGAQSVIPWLCKNSNRHKEYLVIVSDPRTKSLELRETMKAFSKGASLPPDILGKMIVINSDSPAENRRWLRKQNIVNLEVFSDEKREWMREYTALGEKRWAMCLFIIRNGKVERIVRELDMYNASTVVKNAIRSLETT